MLFHLANARLRLLIFCSTVLLVAASCAKKADVTPALPTTGAVEGFISPAGAVSTVQVRGGDGNHFANVDANGRFSWGSLRPDIYTMSFNVQPGYVTLPPFSIRVEAGKTTSIGTVTVTRVSPFIPTGSLSGIISPADAVRTVRLTTSGGSRQSAVPDAAGHFSFSILPLDSYSLEFENIGQYFGMLPQYVTLTTATPNVNLGTIAFASRGTASFNVNGVLQTSTDLSGGPLGNSGLALSVRGTTPGAYSVYFDLTNFSGLGTYHLGGPQGNRATMFLFDPNTPYETSRISPSGSLVVTAYNPTTHQIAGTFAFTTDTPGVVNVNSGTFSYTYY